MRNDWLERAFCMLVLILVGGQIVACTSPVPFATPPPSAAAESQATPLSEPTAASDTLCQATASPTAAAASATLPSDNAQLIALHCGTCHSLDRVRGSPKTREEWVQTVNRMVTV
jgi:cytochrome c5